MIDECRQNVPRTAASNQSKKPRRAKLSKTYIDLENIERLPNEENLFQTKSIGLKHLYQLSCPRLKFALTSSLP